MKRRKFIAVGFVALAALVFAIAAGGVSGATEDTSTDHGLAAGRRAVRLAGRRRGRDNAQFEKEHPGVNVNVQYQTWHDAPAEVRRDARGRQHPRRDRDGQHRDDEVHGGGRLPGPHRRQVVVPELEHLARRAWQLSAGYNGKLFGVPYYAGSRVVTYRTDLFKKAGRQGAEEPRPVHGRRARSLNAKFGKKGFSPVYIAGKDWYFALGFVYDYGGQIATRVERQVEGHARRRRSALAGLTAFKNFFLAASRASKTTDETHPFPYDVFAQGHAASFVGPGLVQLLRRQAGKPSGHGRRS